MKDYPICHACRQPIYRVVVSGPLLPPYDGTVDEAARVPEPYYYHPGCAPVAARREASV